MDSQGQLFIADRGNMRIQILDQDGAFTAEWKQFSRPSGIYIRDEMIYVADSESNGLPFATHPGWKRGLRIGSLKDGRVQYRIPDARNEGNQCGGGFGGGCEGQCVRRGSRTEAIGKTHQIATVRKSQFCEFQ
jgi:hypothetical protein